MWKGCSRASRANYEFEDLRTQCCKNSVAEVDAGHKGGRSSSRSLRGCVIVVQKRGAVDH